MEGTASHRLPPGFRAGTVAARSLRHLVPPDGRLGVCGAPVAASTLASCVGDGERVCDRCIDRLAGRRPMVPQPPARKPKAVAPPPSSVPEPEPPKFTIELPRRIARLLEGVFDPVAPGPGPRGATVRYELPAAEAVVMADVLLEMGERRESDRVLRVTAVNSTT